MWYTQTVRISPINVNQMKTHVRFTDNLVQKSDPQNYEK